MKIIQVFCLLGVIGLPSNVFCDDTLITNFTANSTTNSTIVTELPTTNSTTNSTTTELPPTVPMADITESDSQDTESDSREKLFTNQKMSTFSGPSTPKMGIVFDQEISPETMKKVIEFISADNITNHVSSMNQVLERLDRYLSFVLLTCAAIFSSIAGILSCRRRHPLYKL